MTVAGERRRPVPEDGVQRLHPSVRLVWWVGAALLALPVVAASIVAAVVLGRTVGGGWSVVPACVAVIAVTLAAALPAVRYRNWAYALRDDDLWIRSGVVWRKVTIIPYIRLQFVDTRQGPVERLLGLSQLVVHTAAVGTSGRVPGLDAAAATELRERLSQLEGDTGGL